MTGAEDVREHVRAALDAASRTEDLDEVASIFESAQQRVTEMQENREVEL